jgi:UDP-N-acetylglucosamine transferase subunit ALG13
VIFVTVGAQMPFDRLVKTVDEWAGARRSGDVFAQIGATSYRPLNMRWTQFLQPAEFSERAASAKVIVAHAGTGSIITALQLGKPILVMPRRAALRETRNDHQLATALQFRRFGSVSMAADEAELRTKLERLEELTGVRAVGSHASRQLLDALRRFVAGDSPLPGADLAEDWEEAATPPGSRAG